jgi:hypothetical protein
LSGPPAPVQTAACREAAAELFDDIEKLSGSDAGGGSVDHQPATFQAGVVMYRHEGCPEGPSVLPLLT